MSKALGQFVSGWMGWGPLTFGGLVQKKEYSEVGISVTINIKLFLWQISY